MAQVRGAVQDVKGEFELLRPAMAQSFPFELDPFQKEAVILLEQVPACTWAVVAVVPEHVL